MSRDLASEPLPVESFKTAAAHLRRPFTPGAIKWKVEKVGGGKGMVIGYLDARLAIERMNLVIPDWRDEYDRLDGKWMRCKLTVGNITRQDVGTGNDPKAMFSDALKRAAVKFGIGVSLYAMRATWLPAVREPKKNQLLDTGRKSKQGNPIYEIPANTETYLRELYDQWLKLEDRGGIFGPPLNHGDDPEGSVGELADAEAAPPSDDGPAWDESRANEQITEIEEAFKAPNGNGRKITKGALSAQIGSAVQARSHDELDKILAAVKP